MCCAMTSPQHLVALPSLSSALNPFAPLETGVYYRQQGALLLCQHRQDRGGRGVLLLLLMFMLLLMLLLLVVVRSLCPHLHWVPCAPLTFCFFICSCNVVGWKPERVVVAWFSVIDQRESSQQNKKHVQTPHPPLLLVRETQTLGSGSE